MSVAPVAPVVPVAPTAAAPGAHTDGTTGDDARRFPIGAFRRRDRYSDVEFAHAVERLASQPQRLADALHGLTESDFASPYRSGGWSVRQLVHHVADSHVNAYIRIKLALTEPEPRITAYDQDAWVTLPEIDAVSPHTSVALLTALHARLVPILRMLDIRARERRLLHPDNGPMTVDQVTALYAWHGDHHIAHLLAYRATN